MIVFAGPSLAGCYAEAMDGLDIRPPAAQGDLYLATLDAPAAIAVIDGFFEGAPSVWHKEILWAMSQGIAVLGASSMGALRAAELKPFGMIGVGEIYKAYVAGQIEDDDEVALLHGPAEVGYPTLSLAMVNVRATLKKARQTGTTDAGTADRIIAEAKAQFYKDRSWDSVLAATGDLPAQVTDQVRLLETDQKREDALQLLKVLQNREFSAPETDYHFEQTDLWINATSLWSSRSRAPQHPSGEDERIFADTVLFDG